MVKELQRLAPSEALLLQAMAGLLTRMPDITGVQILHGAQEFGTDLIFSIRGGFEETLLCACIVKNSHISGDTSKAGAARSILLQVQRAFDSTYMDVHGEATNIERVYLVTPFDIDPHTVTAIKGNLKDHEGQLAVISGTGLFDLFKKYWPDFFADDSTSVSDADDLLRRYSDEVHQATDESTSAIDVFVSYSDPDKHEARVIFDKLERERVKVFLAEKSIQAGEIWEEKIKGALKACRSFWILITPNSLRSEWVIMEWAAAWALDKRIVPILLRCRPEDLPKRLQAYHCIDFHNIDIAIRAISREKSKGPP